MKNTSAKLLLASVVLLLNAVGRADVSPSEADTAVWFSEEVDAGKLFLNGQPIQSPVLIEATAAGVFANGVTIPYAAEPTRDDLEEFGEYGDEDEYSGRNRGSRRGNANRSQRELDPSFQATQYARRIRNLLDQSLVVVVFENEPIKPIYTISEQFTLYETLLAEVPTEQQREMFLLLAPKSEYQVTWETWLGEYTPTTVERQEMQAFLDETLASEAAQTRQAQATQRLEMFAYPLTALGMIISVFGFGHLLQWVAKGFADQETAETDTHWTERNWFITTAILLMVVMSALDLAWTILASQAGVMAEVNPVARGMVSDPWSLALFKIAAMGIALVILYFWRHRRQIQQATWWTCLICVLLMFRWVIFDSMSM